MGRRTREHTVKIYQIKDGEIINGEFTCTHQDHAFESIKDYGDYYIEVYDIVGNLIHSENKHLIEIDNTIGEKIVEDTTEPEIIEEIKDPIIEKPVIEQITIEVETTVAPEPKVVKKAPVKKAPAKTTTKPAVKK
jgi:hypothetical protein